MGDGAAGAGRHPVRQRAGHRVMSQGSRAQRRGKAELQVGNRPGEEPPGRADR